jgi:hypothetical protein
MVPAGTQTIRIKTQCVDCDTYVDVNLITPSPSVTPTVTRTPSVTSTPSVTVTPTISISRTPTPTRTPTKTPSVTPTVTPSETATPSVTPTSTISVTPSVTATPSVTKTPSVTHTPMASVTPTTTPNVSLTPSVSVTVTPSISVSPLGIMISDARLATSSEQACYATPSTVYTITGTVLPGLILYQDKNLTRVVTGYNHVTLDDGIIYTLNTISGYIGNDTGNRCKSFEHHDDHDD